MLYASLLPFARLAMPYVGWSEAILIKFYDFNIGLKFYGNLMIVNGLISVINPIEIFMYFEWVFYMGNF